jgi:hypothetical protein
MAATRTDACDVEPWGALDIGESLGILVSIFPGGYKRGVDCILAAHNCEEVNTCVAYFIADEPKYEAEIEQLPECGNGSERTDHCEGNVAKYCVTDDYKTYYEASYDCTLAGATCTVFADASGQPWANCQAPQLRCEGPNTSYCDGTRAVVCEQSGGTNSPLSPWVYDCADAWGSRCVVESGQYNITCQGPVVGEKQCHDGVDNDGDGKIDCDDRDCICTSASGEQQGAGGMGGDGGGGGTTG